MASSLVSSSTARTFSALRAGAFCGASPKILSSMSGCPLQLLPPPSQQLFPPPSIAHFLPVFGAGPSSGAFPNILSSMSGCPLQLLPPPSLAPHIRTSRARAPTSESADLSAPRSIFCCSGSSPSPVVVAVCSGRLDGQREILSDLPSIMGIPKGAKNIVRKLLPGDLDIGIGDFDTVAFFPYISASDPDLSAPAKVSKVLDLCGSVIIKPSSAYSDLLADGPAAATRFLATGCNFDAITSMSKVVPQLSSLVAFLKRYIEKFMSKVKDAGFRGQPPPRDYGVLISYKQEDSLQFVSHLKTALDRRGIKTFIDSTLEAGVEFQPAIEKAIERSEIAVVIVSENYHESPWCLIELEKILECQRKWGLIVLPIFRGMDPKVLREQPRHFVENIGRGEKGFRQLQPHEIPKQRDNLRALGMINALPVLRSSVIREAVDAAEAAAAADQISAKVSRSA